MCMQSQHMRDFDGAFMIRLFHKLACRLITSSLRLRPPWGGGGGGGEERDRPYPLICVTSLLSYARECTE